MIEGKPLFTDLNVIVVDEDVGMGSLLAQIRIEQILANYKRFVYLGSAGKTTLNDIGR